MSDVKESDLRQGNPGIGGTEYVTLYTALRLNDLDVKVRVYSVCNLNVSNKLQVNLVSNFHEAVESSIENKELLVYKPTITKPDYLLGLGSTFPEAALAPWLHLTPSPNLMRQFAHDKRVKRVIFLGASQALQFLDHPVAKKGVVLPNLISTFGTREESLIGGRIDKSRNVVYLGALVPQKGFHVLAKAWPEVSRRFPEVVLHVIGGTNLYRNESTQRVDPGSWTEYERYVRGLLKGVEHSVVFHGLLNYDEKQSILASATLGVVNPSGNTEVLSSSAIEMQSLGIPVVSKKKNGMVDVVLNHETGILILRESSLARVIIKLLGNEEFVASLSQNSVLFVEKTFGSSIVEAKWLKFVNTIEKERPLYSYPCKLLSRPNYIKDVFTIVNSFFSWISNYVWPSIGEMVLASKKIVIKMRKISTVWRVHD